MFLTKDQEAMLNGEKGEVAQRCMRLLTRLGDIYGADKMVPITSAQVSGVSYKSIGDPGLEFLEDIASKGAKVSVFTTLNPAGMDLKDWKSLGFPKGFAENQSRIIKAFEKMGINITVTCTPYLAGNRPKMGDHIAWAESSAVSFANSVLGARTNREGGPSSLAAAVCKVTPNYGLHLEENRKPNFLIKIKTGLKTFSDFGALGYWAGQQVKNKIPYFIGIRSAGEDLLKGLGAAMAASGAVALYHVEGITPEAKNQDTSGLEVLEFGEQELKDSYKKLNTGDSPDTVVFGCPHASLEEIKTLSEKLEGRKVKKRLWICCSRAVKEQAEKQGLVRKINQAGGDVVADTCMVVSPIEKMGFKTTGVNSGKAANYLPGFCKQSVVFRDMNRLIEEIV